MKKITVTEGKVDFIVCNRWAVASSVEMVTIGIIKWYHGNCSKCSHRVTYSEASKILLQQNPKVVLICLESISLQIKLDPKSVELATTPKHLMEVNKIRLAKERNKN